MKNHRRLAPATVRRMTLAIAASACQVDVSNPDLSIGWDITFKCSAAARVQL